MPTRIPGMGSGMLPPNLVDQLVEAQKIPIETARKRKEKIVEEREEVQKLNTFLSDLENSINGIKTQSDFYKLKLESSHPDIVDGSVQSTAMPGTYEFEVRGLAKAEKELAYGFPDKDETPVGFGYMSIEREDQDAIDVVIEPGSTLQQVADQINNTEAGVKAMVINTKYKPDAYRLLVISEKSGAEAKIHLDEDTTFLEFKEQVSGRNLDVLFEDVPVMDDDNNLDELVAGVIFNAKRAEPGTRVQVNITYDVDASVEGIAAMVEKYNALADFVHKQFEIDPKTKKAAGILASDGTIKTVMRQLQAVFQTPENTGGKYRTMADIGITTDPKTGSLKMDDAKVKQALTEDYASVANLFIRSRMSDGIADRLAQRVKALRDPGSGPVRSRLRALDNIIKNSDQDIETKERLMTQKEESLRRRFSSLEGQLSGLKAQGDYLSQKFAGGGGGGGGSGGGGG